MRSREAEEKRKKWLSFSHVSSATVHTNTCATFVQADISSWLLGTSILCNSISPSAIRVYNFFAFFDVILFFRFHELFCVRQSSRSRLTNSIHRQTNDRKTNTLLSCAIHTNTLTHAPTLALNDVASQSSTIKGDRPFFLLIFIVYSWESSEFILKINSKRTLVGFRIRRVACDSGTIRAHTLTRTTIQI